MTPAELRALKLERNLLREMLIDALMGTLDLCTTRREAIAAIEREMTSLPIENKANGRES